MQTEMYKEVRPCLGKKQSNDFSEWSLMLDLVDKNYNSFYKYVIEIKR